MDGYLAKRPIEVDHSLEMLSGAIDPQDLYVVFGSFEGQWEVMRFREFESGVERAFNFDLEESRQALADEGADWLTSLDRAQYIEYVESIRREIKAGWVYQVNACRMLSYPRNLDLSRIFDEIQSKHPAPASGYYKSSRWEIASASPETFFQVRKVNGARVITTRPIKGTSRDGKFKEKDFAENVMIVDLMRNDISPLCKLHTVAVPHLLDVEEHPGLFHLVSDIQGELRDEVSWKEILQRLSPAGSISGAPKSSALDVISRFEPYRGAYCGTLGWIHGGQAHFAVLIRTFFAEQDRDPSLTLFGTGAGITWGSVALDEWQETELKAERLIKLASGALKG